LALWTIKLLETCRNIAAHDYDSLDWLRVKRICEKLTSQRSKTILEGCLRKASILASGINCNARRE